MASMKSIARRLSRQFISDYTLGSSDDRPSTLTAIPESEPRSSKVRNVSHLLEYSTEITSFFTLGDIEEMALKKLALAVREYFGSNQSSKNGFERFLIIPRVLRISTPAPDFKLSGEALGWKFDLPIGLSPAPMHKLVHYDGEVATARTVSKFGIPLILSIMTSSNLENVADAISSFSNAKLWLQIYVFKDKRFTIDLIKRAESAGVSAIVFNIDAPIFARQSAEWRGKLHIPPDVKLPFFETSLFRSNSNEKHGPQCRCDLMSKIAESIDQSLAWESIDWLRSVTKLPIIVGGIMHPQDAQIAISRGASAIMVSTAGGSITPIEALPRVVKAVWGRVPVFIGGGFRRGSDVFKALALGADLVFIGRPIIYGLAVGGQEGLNRTITILKDELVRTMALAGADNALKIPHNLIMHREEFENRICE